MKNEKRSTWEGMIYRPELPIGWFVESQQDDTRKCTTSFVRYGKVHPRAESQKIYVVLIENNMDHRIRPNSKYVVRGGRNAKPDESLHRFNSLHEAEKCLFYLMECTDQWLADVNSPQAEAAYEKKITDAIRRDEIRMMR